MSTYVEFTFCELPDTPLEFNKEKFLAGDAEQKLVYKNAKTPRRKKVLSFGDVVDKTPPPNYARVVPKGCCFIDYDDPDEAEAMREIILASGLRCLILETTKGFHFLFRTPEFYEKEMTKATNWFGMKFDTKATTDAKEAVQILRVCGMEREERCSWDLAPILAESINIETLDVLPYWLWGKFKDTDLHKKGKPGESEYSLKDTPFTQLMKMAEGGRHDHIVTRCSHFGLTNGFMMDEFKALISMIHDKYLVKIGDPMPDSDLFGDLEKRWGDYSADMLSSGWDFDEIKRKWIKASKKKAEKVTEREAAVKLFNEYDCYVGDKNVDGTYSKLLYRKKDESYDYQTDLTRIRKSIKDLSEQNFKTIFFKEVEEQLKQICAENNKLIRRNPQYVIAKNKVLSCVLPDVYDFSWLGTRPPTDVVLPWNWKNEEWVEEHEEDLGGLINNFIKQLARNASGVTDATVEQWLWVVAGAAMIPNNRLEKIVILTGGGQNGKSIFTSLIRLSLGGDMFNMSKIFDSSPQDSFWGAGLDKGILCVVDDMPRLYNRDAFSYIKGAITKTDTVVINEKFKPKKELYSLPMIISCTNHEFELYDKSDGMKRRVLILPTEYHVPDEIKDGDLQYKLVLNTTNIKEIAEYKMRDNSTNGEMGVQVMHLFTREKGVLESLDHGSLCWFANKARYMYFKWLFKELILDSSEGMIEKLEGTFSGGFDAELVDFLEWYITEVGLSTWIKDLYGSYQDWHAEANSAEVEMKEKAFQMKLGKAIKTCVDKDYKIEMRKRKNDRGMSMNYVFIGEDEKKEE